MGVDTNYYGEKIALEFGLDEFECLQGFAPLVRSSFSIYGCPKTKFWKPTVLLNKLLSCSKLGKVYNVRRDMVEVSGTRQ